MIRFGRVTYNGWNRFHLRQFTTKSSHDTDNFTLVVDNKSIEQLERLSLVNFGSAEGIARLESAITFAKQLWLVELNADIQPMYTVLENQKLKLRDDQVFDGGYTKKVLKNAALTEEDYFIAPPGNVPVNLTTNKY
ncbi:glutamyl-tRNA(Gln) amidotransferase subunit C, mitochondrial [Neodiprion pinetum]|uniref:Glutamyl-tRNA(Gln) amidotransferase subunit C, mitochondrial n=1 Tax=Neodiprion lecontei TaxID=441921 RepID=A0A6J0B3E9_NEOLC|nr:glutamyl-tRNA(Gln) amidotransferase subunit C, mitochondrial [Neodiprion lecontei]XP_046417613.1 glutamyl-tRNA(Gln) amidotransferase subunit C, mitochondrial [Neodiprion fabricii]XP_046471023.1 glutamyl-tRNA(Gln) amidotransferase subunit C, mitochondrial [Neodiprion pinetum]XP_046611025.1 glutamyl-tRNA(Gln) amidotransferase subunit C, mitochondrial [Neodiprion virginianus]